MGLLEPTLATDDRLICRLGTRWCGRCIAALGQENEQARAPDPSAIGIPRAKISGTLLGAPLFPFPVSRCILDAMRPSWKLPWSYRG